MNSATFIDQSPPAAFLEALGVLRRPIQAGDVPAASADIEWTPFLATISQPYLRRLDEQTDDRAAYLLVGELAHDCAYFEVSDWVALVLSITPGGTSLVVGPLGPEQLVRGGLVFGAEGAEVQDLVPDGVETVRLFFDDDEQHEVLVRNNFWRFERSEDREVFPAALAWLDAEGGFIATHGLESA